MRVAIGNNIFQAVWIGAQVEYTDLTVELWELNTNVKVAQYTPAPYIPIPNMQICDVQLPHRSGVYEVRWILNGQVVFNEDAHWVTFDPRNPPGASDGVGTPFFPTRYLPNIPGAPTLKVFQRDVNLPNGDSPAVSGSYNLIRTIPCAERIPGSWMYYPTSALVFDERGEYLLVWEANSSVVGFESRDIFDSANKVTVTVGTQDAGGAPLPNLTTTVIREDGWVAYESLPTDVRGAAVLLVDPGVYSVSFRDPERPNRVFSRNNFRLSVDSRGYTSPVGTVGGSDMVVYTLNWKDLPPVQPFQLPTQYLCRLAMQYVTSPSGRFDTRASPLRILVTQLNPMQVGDYLVAAGMIEYMWRTGELMPQIYLIRGATVRVECPDLRMQKTFQVPDQEVVAFRDIPSTDPFGVLTVETFDPARAE